MLTAADVDDPLPLAGAAHHHLGGAAAGARLAEALEVEGVERLAELEHHEVGHVDDVVDGADPGGAQAPLHPSRRRSDSDVLDDPHGETRTPARVLDPDADPVLDRRHRGERLGYGGRRFGQRLAEGRGQLAGEADVTEAVGTVGGDLDLEHRVEVEHLAGRLPGDAALEDEQALGVVAEPELDRRAEEPGRFHAEHHLLSDRLGPAGQAGAGWRIDHEVAGARVGRRGEERHRGVPADVDLRPAHAVLRLRDGMEGVDPRHHRVLGVAVDVVDLGPGVDERLHEGGERGVEGRVVAQPAQRDPHWRMKRTSFSKSRRPSSMP